MFPLEEKLALSTRHLALPEGLSLRLNDDRSAEPLNYPTKTVYDLGSGGLSRNLGEVWSQEGMHMAESIYSPRRVDQTYNKVSVQNPRTQSRGSKDPNFGSGLAVQNSRVQKLQAQNITREDAGKRYSMPTSPKKKSHALKACQ